MTGDEPDSLRLAMQLIEEDRAHLAHEIHDALLPLIFVAHAGIQRLIEEEAADRSEPTHRPEERRQRLTQIRGWLDEAMQTGRGLLTRTHPAELTDRSWDVAAADILQGEFPGAEPRWEIDPQARELPLECQTAAFRIVVEAVRNALRHGQASDVHIAAGIDREEVSVRVRDNGKGFDPQQVPGDRYGIRAMRGRAALVGGRLDLQSRPGGPTTVELRFPRSPLPPRATKVSNSA